MGVPISIHALCEEGDAACCESACVEHISIHALCEEGDDVQMGEILAYMKFLSTPSARRATGGGRSSRWWPPTISIHALCEEGDGIDRAGKGAAGKFLSTPSARRATRHLRDLRRYTH